MNHFFALTLPEEMRRKIADHSRRWRELLGTDFPAHWYEPEDYHVTLKFLGDVPDERQAELISTAAPVAEATEPFGIPMASPGVFPNERFVNVLIRHLRSGDELLSLYRRMEAGMQTLGFPREGKRDYLPHVTVARCRRRLRQEVPILSISHEQMFVEFSVDRLVLMRTTPPETRQKDRPIRYNTVHTFPFGNTH